MIFSRRQFLASSSIAALPVVGVPAAAALSAQPYEIGEIWGMRYVARGAEAATVPRRRHRKVHIG
ncbi:hypothetical protein M3P36_10990 [Altererythrobacter sp. KTW20L]|uniref:hypothetical protein n=1 Tax=Altererythrobacter sp. KTW20L TaxID=2942210 RepID=UPI0020BF4652|nr:hypothetical protein [Altererythrobacter sp. KTW20L]MCL6251558.1 hypothetical protein [Altererythrobacter sp. KTW20L]